MSQETSYETSHETLIYLRNVLGVRSILRTESALLQESTSTLAPPTKIGERTAPRVFGPSRTPYALVLQSPYLSSELKTWKDALYENDRETFERLIMATGYLPEEVRLVFVADDEECDVAAVASQVQARYTTLVMGRVLGAQIWGATFDLERSHGELQSSPVSWVPVHGLLEINADPQFKRLLWNDIKMVLKSVLRTPVKRI